MEEPTDSETLALPRAISALLLALGVSSCVAPEVAPMAWREEARVVRQGVFAAWKPVQVGIWGTSDVQLFDRKSNVYGLRLNLPSGSNRDVIGLDVGFYNQGQDAAPGYL
jgi:hypothetical protein